MYTDGLSIAPELLWDLYYCKRVVLVFICEARRRPHTYKQRHSQGTATFRLIFVVPWQLVIAASCLDRCPPMTQYTAC